MNRRFKYFAIFGSMRSGSNLLEQSLNQYADVTCHGELFNPSFIGKPNSTEFLGHGFEDREKTPKSLIKAMIHDAGDDISGFRVFLDHDERTATAALEDSKCAKIVLRRDPLQSYISLKIAQATDQWLLHDAPDRRGSKIIFDTEEFQTYHAEQFDYYAKIRSTLQKTGQSAFWIHYPEQRDVEVLNGLVKFLGVEEELKSVKETIRKQNPGSLRDKVENYDEMLAALADPENNAAPWDGSDPTRRANIPKMVSCLSLPLLFAPIPGGPNEEVFRWMNTLDRGANQPNGFEDAVAKSEILHTGHNQRTLLEWMQSNPDLVTFCAVRHPISRAYSAFMSKIFDVGPDAYDVIRTQLVNYFGVALPPSDELENCTRKTLNSNGYGIGQHRAAFHAFLRFLKDNLAGQTSIRKDGLWDSQMSFIAGFTTAVPIGVILKEGRLDAGFRYIENLLDVPKPELGHPLNDDHLFSLDEIYTRQTENLARKAYAMDYARFGFEDYQAALEA